MKTKLSEIINYFKNIDNQISNLIEISNPIGTETEKKNWEIIKNLEGERFNKTKQLFINNNPDEMSDYVHDSILDDGNNMPKGYKATIVASFRDFMKGYRTIGFITTPNKSHYFISVRTYSKVKLGTKL